MTLFPREGSAWAPPTPLPPPRPHPVRSPVGRLRTREKQCGLQWEGEQRRQPALSPGGRSRAKYARQALLEAMKCMVILLILSVSYLVRELP